jgi:hypothetical protein
MLPVREEGVCDAFWLDEVRRVEVVPVGERFERKSGRTAERRCAVCAKKSGLLRPPRAK